MVMTAVQDTATQTTNEPDDENGHEYDDDDEQNDENPNDTEDPNDPNVTTDPLGQAITTTWDDFRTMPLHLIGVIFMFGMMFQSFSQIVNWVFVAVCAVSFVGGAACGTLAASQFEPVGVFVNYVAKWLSLPRAVWHMPMARFESASVVLTSASSIGSGVNAIASGVEAVANAMSNH